MPWKPAPDPIVRTYPFLAELRDGDRFLLYRGPDDPTMPPDAGEPTDRLLIVPGELTALRTVLVQVWAHPRFVQGQWDTPSVEAAPWEIGRTAAAVVIAGPVWNATLHASSEIVAEVEYARLEELVAALGEV